MSADNKTELMITMMMTIDVDDDSDDYDDVKALL